MVGSVQPRQLFSPLPLISNATRDPKRGDANNICLQTADHPTPSSRRSRRRFNPDDVIGLRQGAVVDREALAEAHSRQTC